MANGLINKLLVIKGSRLAFLRQSIQEANH